MITLPRIPPSQSHKVQSCLRGEGGDIGGHVLRETTSRGLCGLVCPSHTSEHWGDVYYCSTIRGVCILGVCVYVCVYYCSTYYKAVGEGGGPGVLGSIPVINTHTHTHAQTRGKRECVVYWNQGKQGPRSLVCDGQTSPHRPRLVVSRCTCPPLSPSPHANSFVIGPAVLNTHIELPQCRSR